MARFLIQEGNLLRGTEYTFSLTTLIKFDSENENPYAILQIFLSRTRAPKSKCILSSFSNVSTLRRRQRDVTLDKQSIGDIQHDQGQDQLGAGLSCLGSQYFPRLSFAVHPHLSILDQSLHKFSLDSANTLKFLLTSKFRSSITIVTFPIAGT